MRKFTLFIASLFLALGAMAQTFVEPEVGKYYKIKGDHSSLCWLTSEIDQSSKAIKVSSNENDAAVFERTSNGFRVVSTGMYLGMNGAVISYVNAEAAVTVHNTGSQYHANGKYAIKVVNNWLYNNSTETNPVTHESEGWISNIERFWGFIEVNQGGGSDDDGKIVADGVYTIDNKFNGRGSMAYGDWAPNWYSFSKEYFGLTDITLSGYAKNSVDVDPVSNKYWYVKTTDKGVYIYNIGKGFFLQNYAAQKVTCSTEIANGFVLVERTANNTKYVSVKSGDYYLSYSCGWEPNSADGSVRWLKDDEEAATLMTFTPVANAATNYANEIAAANAKINAFEVDNEAAKAALAEKIAQAEDLLATITIGDGVGEYSCGGYTEAEVESLLGSAKGFYNSITSDTEVANIEAYIEFMNETIALCSLNMPKAGDYFRIKAVAGWNDDAPYLTSVNTTVSGNTTRAAFVANADASTIFYFDGTQLVSYASGHYLVKDAYNMLGYNGVQTEGSKVGFRVATKGLLGAYNISFDNGKRWLYVNNANYTDAGGSTNDANGYCFNLEEVESLPVTITAAGYATFFAPVAVEVPEGVTAHTLTINGEWATLSEPLTVVPANTGVVLAGEGVHNLVITEDVASIENNALRGSVETKYFTAKGTYYALGLVDGVVAFYKDEFKNNRFQNNSHKAYLYIAEGNGVASFSFRFEGEGTTGIGEVKGENGEVKGIYDLTGRRVEEITAPGIYIVNGKKVLVK